MGIILAKRCLEDGHITAFRRHATISSLLSLIRNLYPLNKNWMACAKVKLEDKRLRCSIKHCFPSRSNVCQTVLSSGFLCYVNSNINLQQINSLHFMVWPQLSCLVSTVARDPSSSTRIDRTLNRREGGGLLVARLHSVGWKDDWRIWEDWEGSDLGLIKILSLFFLSQENWYVNEIRKGHSNTCYRCKNLLAMSVGHQF